MRERKPLAKRALARRRKIHDARALRSARPAEVERAAQKRGSESSRKMVTAHAPIEARATERPSRALRPCDFEPPDQGTRSTAPIIVVIAARQLRYQTSTGERTPVQGPGVGYSI